MTDEYLSQWITKAEGDLTAAKILFQKADQKPVTESVCFHSQQAVEKYLKTYLISRGIEFHKSHNLNYIIKLCAQKDREFENIDIGTLSFYAVEIRYPDEFYTPSYEEAEQALTTAQKAISFIKEKLKN